MYNSNITYIIKLPIEDEELTSHQRFIEYLQSLVQDKLTEIENNKIERDSSKNTKQRRKTKKFPCQIITSAPQNSIETTDGII
jgi:hypothetical protein